MFNRLRFDRFLSHEPPSHNDNRPAERTGKTEDAAAGWLGIMMQRITPNIASAMGLPGTDGALIADVTPNGPAAKAGLEVGDVITGFAGSKIATLHDLAAALAGIPAGRTMEMTVIRQGKSDRVTVTLGKAMHGERVVAPSATICENRKLGLILAGLPEHERNVPAMAAGSAAVRVVELIPDGAAGANGVKLGDIVISFDGTPVQDPIDASNAVKHAEACGKKAIALLVNRDGANRFIGVPLGTSAG